MISFGVQLKKQQPELKLEAEMTVRALVRNVHVCMLPTCSLFYGLCLGCFKDRLVYKQSADVRM